MSRTCAICDTVPIADLTELDLLMGDAARWPSTIWGIFSPPKGPMNALRQRFGAVQMAKMWLAEHGYGFSEPIIRRHYRYDVVVIAASAEDLINRGIIAAAAGSEPGKLVPAGEQIDARAYLTYFNRGIQLGNRGLELLHTRIEALIAADEDVPTVLLLKVAELGRQLATTQAMLRARNVNLGEDVDEDEGFRAGSAPLPSPRMGHQRIRVIEGEARPVTDTGPADREAFSERSKQEGGPGLPH